MKIKNIKEKRNSIILIAFMLALTPEPKYKISVKLAFMENKIGNHSPNMIICFL
tara:strand:- start:272 stop:433 length:162 start_codon:yes stop_codon:yes gene_type:complete